VVYGGILVVPIGAIVAAEHFLFPRIGLTRYWARYRKLTVSIPAIATWALSLAFALALDALDWVSFYWLFLPEYAFGAALYTALAAMSGARRSYPKQEARDEERAEALAAFEHEQATIARENREHVPVRVRLAGWIGWAALAAIVLLALWVVLASGDAAAAERNRALFHWAALGLTIVYFAGTLLSGWLDRDGSRDQA